MVTKFKEIIDKIEKIDPVNYAKNRNFIFVATLRSAGCMLIRDTKFTYREHNSPITAY